MATSPGNIRNPNSMSGIITGFVIGGVCLLVLTAVWIAGKAGGAAHVPNNPLAMLVLALFGQVGWSAWSTVILIVLLVVIGAPIVAGVRWWRANRTARMRVDSALPYVANVAEVASLTEPEIVEKATRLQVVVPTTAENPWATPGVPIGRMVSGWHNGKFGLFDTAAPLYGSCEDMHCDIWGPRQGKSSTRIMRAICEAPGAVLATENKRGNLDHTRLLREFRVNDAGEPDPTGNPTRAVWVFDPQQVANEEPTFWWNPLSYIIAADDRPGGTRTQSDVTVTADNDVTVVVVTSDPEERAASLAEQFASGEDADEARKDPYFDPEGQDLVASLLLAAAIGGHPITIVDRWLTHRGECDDAARILDDHGFTRVGNALTARLGLTGKQQDGIFGTALKMVRCLRSERLQPWITTHPGDTRPHLDVHQFIANNETLYCLSKEGVGSVGPITAALTIAACEAAEEIATASPGGRLPTQMLCALDEIANVVRWKRLPSLYSHYGSRGILVMTVLQSWSQGEQVWGVKGMKQLWGASNVKVYGGNVDEDDFLDMLSKLVGDYDREVVSVSRTGDQQTVTRSTSRERLFTIGELRSWPRGRALMFSAGNPAAIVETVQWKHMPYAAFITASTKEYGEKRAARVTAPVRRALDIIDARVAANRPATDKELVSVDD